MEIVNHINFEKNPLQTIEQALMTGDIYTISTPTGNVVMMSDQEYRNRMAMWEIDSNPNYAHELLEASSEPKTPRISRKDLGI